MWLSRIFRNSPFRFFTRVLYYSNIKQSLWRHNYLNTRDTQTSFKYHVIQIYSVSISKLENESSQEIYENVNLEEISFYLYKEHLSHKRLISH